MSKKSNFATHLLILVSGLTIGWLASLLTSDKTRKNQQKFIKKQIESISDYLKDTELKQRVTDIFTKYSTESKEIYKTAQKSLITHLTAAKESLEEIDKKKYAKIVGGVIEELKETTSISSKNLEKLKSYFLTDLSKIKKHYSQINTEENES